MQILSQNLSILKNSFYRHIKSVSY